MLQSSVQGKNLPIVFSFNEHCPLRTLSLLEQPWFAAVDICDILGLKNPSDRLKRLDDDERSMFNIGRQGKTWFVNESGLFNLILRSDKPEARRLRKWVTSEVLPSLRRKGSYSMTVAPDLLGLHGILIEGHPYYDYLDLLSRIGCSTTSGSKDGRRRKNPQEFCELNNRWRVSGNFSGYIMRMARIRKEQAEIRERRIKYLNEQEDRQAEIQMRLFPKGGDDGSQR